MRPYKTILFMFCVFALMGLIGYAIPAEGITIGGVNFLFPSPAEVMQSGVNDEVYYRELEKHNVVRVEEKTIQEWVEEGYSDEYIELHRNVLTHNYSPLYPDNNAEYMFPLFEALEGAKDKKVRIIHYGDSQIEEDRMSNYLRNAFQSEFGGYGVGLIPAIQTVPTASFGQKCSRSLTRYLVYGTQSMHMDEGKYGPLGQTSLLTDTAKFSFYRINYGKTRNNTKYFDRITILLEDVTRTTSATVSVKGKSETKVANVGDRSIVFYLPDSTTKASIFMDGEALIHGFMVDGSDSGVQLDNAAMRGCSGTIFTSIKSESLRDYYRDNSVPLIIMQFGGNRVPYTKGDKAIASYCEQLTRQIKYLRVISPNSVILFIGPSDMSTNVDGEMKTYPHLPKLVNALRDMCSENGIAYWDLYKSMGGYNSMTKWVNSGLAGSDHIHFTHAGSDKASQMLWEGLMQAYELYKMSKVNSQKSKVN